VVGSEMHVCNATECIIAVQGHFRSTKVVDFCITIESAYSISY